MTICVMVKVSEGLVLAADSAAALSGRLGNQPGVLKTYEHSRKLAHIKDYPIGTLAWGTSLIGLRSVQSLIQEFEYGLPSLEEERQKTRESRSRGEEHGPFEYSVKEIAQGLLEHIQRYYTAEFDKGGSPQQPFLGVLVAGFSSGRFFPEHWLFELPHKGELVDVRPDCDGKPDFGAHFFGLTDAIVRVHWGRDNQALDILAKHFKVPPEEIQGLLAPLQYVVPYAGMPLQDAIDYAVYLVNVVIGRYRFVVGAPLCGGEIEVAVVTPNSLEWIKHSSWQAD